MAITNRYDAIVVGSGPNGLAAAIHLARQGHAVKLYEARETVGGGTRSAQLTLPGFTHDVCSAIHPLALASPFFRTIPFEKLGVEWIQPPAALAHPLDDGSAVVLAGSIEATARRLGDDSRAYVRLMGPLVGDWENLISEILGPLRIPRHPIILSRFGLQALRSAQGLIKGKFSGERARALLAGMAAHSMMRLDRPPTAAFSLMLGMLAHAVGWPMARGGSQAIADALADHFISLGGSIETNKQINSVEDLPAARAVLFDLTPKQLLPILGSRIPRSYRRRLQRYRYGPGVFKIDWALDEPIPWAASECLQAGTVHIGGHMEEIVAAEGAVWDGEHPDRPFVLLAQQSLFDPSRAPEGKHTAWAYCHVPNGSTEDMTTRIENQVERFAPGFREVILARATMNASELEIYNPNYAGGDINGGVQDLRQHFTRPAPRINPYRIPGKGLYLCSSATPPGGGVHGMCGYFAARSALSRELAA